MLTICSTTDLCKVDGTNALMNPKTRVASDTQQEAKGPLLDSADPQHFKGENCTTKGGNDESFVTKEVEIASDMEASVTVAVRDVGVIEVAGPGLHAEEGRTGDTVNSGSILQLPKAMTKENEMLSGTVYNEILEMRRHNIQREQESYGIPPNELRLVVIGKSGNGKSSTANTIIGEDIFETGATATSITKETHTHRASRFGKEILLVDTPGLFDPEMERKETENEISRCMWMTLPGFHAFLFVVRVGRFTAEEMNTVKEFEKLFGEKLYDFMIIVFTRTDDLVHENIKLEDFIRHNVPLNLKQLIERCNRRYVGLNNRDLENKQKTTKYLLEMIETMIDSKHPNHYTNEAFEKADKDFRETIKAEKEIMKAAKKAQFEEMFAEQEKKMREDHVTTLKEMKDACDKERKQLDENATRRLEEEREMMKARFSAETKAMLEKERNDRDALLNQQREDSEKARKNITDKFEEEIKGIKDDNVKKERLADELKHTLELETYETERFRKRIAQKEKEDKEMLAKLTTDHDKRINDLNKRFDNERESRESDEKEHKANMKRQNEQHESLLEEQLKRMKLEHELYIAKEARTAAMREESKWFRFGKFMGLFK